MVRLERLELEAFCRRERCEILAKPGFGSAGEQKRETAAEIPVRLERLELPTLGSEDRCSVQLSYRRSR